MGARRTVRSSLLLAETSLRRSLLDPQVLVPTIVVPVALLCVVLVAFGEIASTGSPLPYIARACPLLVLSGAAFGSVGVAQRLVLDRSDGLLTRLRSLPIPARSVFAGRILADGGRVLLGGSVVVAAGVLAGFRFRAGVLAAVGFFSLVLVVGFAFASVAVSVGLRARSPEAVVGLSLVFQLMLFVNTAFVPLEAFPGWVQPVARVGPYTSATNALIGLSYGGSVLHPAAQTLAWALTAMIVSVLLADRAFARMQA